MREATARWGAVPVALLAVVVLAAGRSPRPALERIVANPNQRAAGTLANGVLTLHLEIRRGLWYPETDDGASLPVLAFGEAGRPLSIPGPMIRVPTGTTIRVTVTNTLADSALYLRGLQGHPGRDTPVRLPPGESRELSFGAGSPGTYYYWAGFSDDSADVREADDSQLSGAFVVDPPGAVLNDRVFVIGNWFDPKVVRDVMVINGKSWPDTERFEYQVGDSVHWRWINATTNSHPMHLHGFYFLVESEGSYLADRPHPKVEQPFVVTHLLLPTRTMRLSFRPDRAGNWIFHCHFAFHTSPFLAMDTLAALHAHSMHGLVLGLTVRPKAATAAEEPAEWARSRVPRAIRLLVQSKAEVYGKLPGMGYVIQGDREPAADSIVIPGPLLLLRQHEPVAVTIVNRLDLPTAVHWHGIELNSAADGVPNWSGSAPRIFPPIPPGDSFIARFTPPRAGTFIYHTHFAEMDQMRSGLYGPLVVLPAGEAFDTVRNRIILVSARGPDDSTLCCGAPPLVNGSPEPPPMRLTAGMTYRFRLINIHADWRVRFRLVTDSGALPWTPVAKDGADLPAGARIPNTRTLVTGPGETADFAVRLDRPGVARLEITSNSAGWYVPLELIFSARPASRRSGT